MPRGRNRDPGPRPTHQAPPSDEDPDKSGYDHPIGFVSVLSAVRLAMRDMQPAFLEPAALEELLGRDDVRVLRCSWFARRCWRRIRRTPSARGTASTGSRGCVLRPRPPRDAGARACRTRFERGGGRRARCGLAWRATTWSCYTARPAGRRRRRAAWLVFTCGPPRVALLAGGLARWVSEGRALVRAPPRPSRPTARAVRGRGRGASCAPRGRRSTICARSAPTHRLPAGKRTTASARKLVPVDGQWVEFTEHRAGHIRAAHHVSAAACTRQR